MAWYVDGSSVIEATGAEKIWTTDYDPADTVPQSGIYKCRVCRKEVTCNEGDRFPPQNHHQHPQLGPVKWRLLVWTNTTGE